MDDMDSAGINGLSSSSRNQCGNKTIATSPVSSDCKLKVPGCSLPLFSLQEFDKAANQASVMAEVSGLVETHLLTLEEGGLKKSEHLEDMMENVEFISKTSKDSTDPLNHSFLSSFENDFEYHNQFAQDSYSIEDIFPTAFPGTSFDDTSQTVESWPSSLFPPFALVPSCPNLEDNPENLSRVFMEFLNTNRDCLSVADLRNIKLKTSTVESATQRLGGGKRGLAYLLKLILIWIQNHHLPWKEQKCDDYNGLDNKLLNSFLSMPSSTEDQLMKAEMDLHESFGNAKCKGNNVNLINMMTSQGEINLSPTPEMPAHMYSKIAPSLNSDIGLFRQIDNHPGGLAIREPQLCSCSTANVNSFYQHNLFSPTCPFSVHNQLLRYDRSLFTEVSTMEATLGGSGLSFAYRMPLDNSPAATTRAARRSRMARQRWSIRHAHFQSSAGINQISCTSQLCGSSFQTMSLPSEGYNIPITSAGETKQGKRSEKSLRLLLQKELKQSDVGNLGRIVLPKKEAELNLPYLAIRDGINVVVEDWSCSKLWVMRYRFWPNNKSRMYLLENTGDFVKFHHLVKGDYMKLYGDIVIGKYAIRGIKTARKDTSSTGTCKSSFSSCHSSGSTDAGQIVDSSQPAWCTSGAKEMSN